MIVAPSITAPLESLTVPLMVAEDCWEKATGGNNNAAIATRKTTVLFREMNRNMIPLLVARQRPDWMIEYPNFHAYESRESNVILSHG